MAYLIAAAEPSFLVFVILAPRFLEHILWQRFCISLHKIYQLGYISTFISNRVVLYNIISMPFHIILFLTITVYIYLHFINVIFQAILFSLKRYLGLCGVQGKEHQQLFIS